jgi:hypothetical protein
MIKNDYVETLYDSFGTRLRFAQIILRNGASETGEFLAPRTLRTQSDTPRRVIVSERERSKKDLSLWSK